MGPKNSMIFLIFNFLKKSKFEGNFWWLISPPIIAP